MNRIFIYLILGAVLISCSSNETLSNKQVETYTKQGKKIAEASFKKLSGQLKKAIKNGGITQAIQFCNAAALPLTDSLSTEHGAIIKRTSLKLRNQKDAPDNLEKKMLNMYLIMSRMRKPVMVPKILKKNNNEIQFYAPIMIKNEICLKCHGIVGKTILPNDYETIKKLYPNDQATGYKLGEFRGMWSISLPRGKKGINVE